MNVDEFSNNFFLRWVHESTSQHYSFALNAKKKVTYFWTRLSVLFPLFDRITTESALRSYQVSWKLSEAVRLPFVFFSPNLYDVLYFNGLVT